MMTSILISSFTFCYLVSYFVWAQTPERTYSIFGTELVSLRRVCLRFATTVLTFAWLLPTSLLTAPRGSKRISVSSLLLPLTLGATRVNSVKEVMALCKLTPYNPKDANHSCLRIWSLEVKIVWHFSPNHFLQQMTPPPNLSPAVKAAGESSYRFRFSQEVLISLYLGPRLSEFFPLRTRTLIL